MTNKLAYLMHDSVVEEMAPADIPVMNRFLKELGSQRQMEDDGFSE